MRKEAKLQDTQNPDIWAWATRGASFLLLLELLAEADLSFGWGGLLDVMSFDEICGGLLVEMSLCLSDEMSLDEICGGRDLRRPLGRDVFGRDLSWGSFGRDVFGRDLRRSFGRDVFVVFWGEMSLDRLAEVLWSRCL